MLLAELPLLPRCSIARATICGVRERPPTTLLVYLALWATILVPALVVASENGVVVATVAIASLLLVALLWRGSRVAWVLLLVLELSVLLSIPFDPTPWWVVLRNVVALALLVARPTRRYVAQ